MPESVWNGALQNHMIVNMKYGLVLEGGAMRGMYTAGVLDILMDENVTFDCIMGVSAGALFGVNYLSRQRGRVIRYNKRFNGDRRYMGLGSLIRTGNFVNTEFAYGTVALELDPFDDETYRKAATPFYAVVTDLDTGRPEYIQIRSVIEQMDTLRASGSMPFLSKPVQIDGRRYLDGGVSDSIPYRKLLELGYDRLIVILTRDESYVKKPMNPRLISLFYGKYKGFAEDLLHRHDEYNESVKQLSALEAEGKAFLIRPSEPITISRVEKDPDKLQGVYEIGLSDARRLLPSLRTFMSLS